jgi:thiol-disulfide isomerase/thioredoxin
MKQSEQKRFWSVGRAAAAAALFLSAAVFISSCTADDTSRDAATKQAQPSPSAPKITITSQPGARPQQPQQAASDKLSPSVLNAELLALDGGKFSLADYKDKTLVLDLWATWCGPCRKEVPHLVEIQKEYESKGVEVVGLTLENPTTDEQKVRDFAKEFSINYKVGWAQADFAMEIMRGNGSIPQTFVIAPGGRVVAHYRGYSDQIPGMIRAAIDKSQSATETSQK